ncbi:MAG: PIN domain-containing protein [Candidatus Kapaibacterium sp.]|nr:MAG: PIN domain-containing protein [Candidatus Kapabacteria bacterium]
MRVIVDTGFFVGYMDKDDQYHRWAVQAADRHKLPFYTCEAVIAEAAYMLQQRLGAKGIAALLTTIVNGSVHVDFTLVYHAERIVTLAQRYENVPMDYADACLVVMAEQEKYREHVILTVDDTDFRIYRRNGREALTLDTPQN